MDDILLEPLEAYKRVYRAAFEKNAADSFDELVERSGISEEQNRKTVSAYDAKMRKVAELEKRLSKSKGIMAFLIVLIVAGGAICLPIGITGFVMRVFWLGSLFLVLGLALIAVGVGLLVGKIRPILKRTEAERDKRKSEADGIVQKAWAEMAPLNALFDDGITKRLIEKTVPTIRIDENFNMRRYDRLHTKYGFGEPNDPQRSTVGILTGEINGNSFLVDRELVHTMGSRTYSGSLTISWSTTYTDSDGHVHIQHHTQTLVAYVTKPLPVYSTQTRLIYGNDAAPDLHFSRKAAHAERLNEKARERTVRRGSKKIKKLQNAAMKDDDPTTNFTEMGNPVFDVLFGALDRDNEVQFRLLFTPLAQKNMIALLTDPAGFGDDFTMRKNGPMNYIFSEHAAARDLDAGYKRYFSYSVGEAKKKFVDFNCDFFKSLYFDLAPLLAIPLYQQQKPREFLYSEPYSRNYTAYESEYLANRMGRNLFCHPDTATETILKTSFEEKEGATDRVSVTAYSYRAEDRVDFVERMGGDGYLHAVPVHWVEYIPVVNTATVRMKELGLSERAFDAGATSGPLKEALDRCGIRSLGYGHGILCCMTADDAPIEESLKDIVKNHTEV